MNINLVDQIGTIEDAITWAALSIDGVNSVNDVEIVNFPKPLTRIEMLMESLAKPAEQNILTKWAKASPGKVYARMPYDLIIK
jgi:ClpP class serine protease